MKTGGEELYVAAGDGSVEVPIGLETVMEDAEMPYNPESAFVHPAQTAFEEQYLDVDGVVGVGLGQNEHGDDAIVVYLRDIGVFALIPKKFKGMDVVPEVIGVIDAY